MSKMPPLPPTPTNADLAEALVSVHGCLEEHIASTKLRDAEKIKAIRHVEQLAKKNQQKADAFQTQMNERMTTQDGLIVSAVSKLDQVAQGQAQTAEALEGLNRGLADVTAVVAGYQETIKGVRKMGRDVVVGVAVALILATGATIWNQRSIHADSATQRELIARTQSRYTAEDAKRDRDAQTAINQAMLTKLDALSNHP